MDEEKTRILSPGEQHKLRLLRPKTTGDKIVFFCSNGHRIVAPLGNAGMAGTCSKCNVPVKVPAGSSPARTVSSGEGSAAPDLTRIVRGEAEVRARAPEVPSPVAPPPALVPPAAAMTDAPPVAITAPPHTPVKRMNADQGAPHGDPPGIDASEHDDQADGPHSWNFLGGKETAAEPAAEGDEAWTEPSGEDRFAAASDNPTAVLLGRLWEEQQHGGLVQVHLKDGGLILPQEYAPRWSQGTHALFASSEADGTITLTAVAWESIQKIVVRNLKDGLPPGMFD